MRLEEPVQSTVVLSTLQLGEKFIKNDYVYCVTDMHGTYANLSVASLDTFESGIQVMPLVCAVVESKSRFEDVDSGDTFYYDRQRCLRIDNYALDLDSGKIFLLKDDDTVRIATLNLERA